MVQMLCIKFVANSDKITRKTEKKNHSIRLWTFSFIVFMASIEIIMWNPQKMYAHIFSLLLSLLHAPIYAFEYSWILVQ